MRTGLAERLLIEIMNWSTKEVGQERPLLQAVSNFKYDEYQQYSIGTLFMESLVKWLRIFETLEERKVAYNFIKNQLIFISNNQMLHLVNTTFNTKIQPILFAKTAEISGVNRYDISKIIDSSTYKKISRRSLYVGLSDGSKIDQLRRNSKLNNEQVITTYAVNEDKVKDMLEELEMTGETEKFDTVFLVDDFTASGTSYFREESKGVWKGKIFKTINGFFDSSKPLSKLVNIEKKLDVHLIFYIATIEAIENIRKIEKIADEDEKFKNLNFKIHVLQTIEPNIKDDILNNEKEFIELSKKYIESSIVDSHFTKAKHTNYFLGYNECCLPLILAHNTPNNSLPLLWWTSENNEFVGLFPRITRHS